MKLMDISQGLYDGMHVYPGDYQTTLEPYKSFGNDGYNSYLLRSCLHAGTHIDAPLHMLAEGKMIADYDIDNFAGEGVLLDVRGEGRIMMKPQYSDMDFCGRIVLLYTGFDEHYGGSRYFEEYPVLDDELAELFVEKKIKMLGLDTPSPDYYPFDVHKKLLSNGIFILENLTNLRGLTDTPRFEVMALPLKITAEASFTRAVCRIG